MTGMTDSVVCVIQKFQQYKQIKLTYHQILYLRCILSAFLCASISIQFNRQQNWNFLNIEEKICNYSQLEGKKERKNMKQQDQIIIKVKVANKIMSQISRERNKKKIKKEIFCFKLVFIIKNATVQNKKTLFTPGQVTNLRDQCNLLEQNLSMKHLHCQFYCYFLSIKEKICSQLVNQKEKMKKKYGFIRLINNKSKS
ncbi:transmembrane protein, putative (macronuclear) [Tetrahymena thermophila SB210]|uniref:Transmembrane protein, putative n=1 Tax=Tetrahymena thermophila (strain SB210) TaxID=312017 RepID=W7XJR6_TETTS|nr:transmembrane protein, putative [Tetrahymena thermophila SB210]EWS75861.1 transmembrane protein, putative [Tetrahymena thermophila SB210]|eukprot:XP_012651596.1 transmembrane protein, putative [Tetrahymena thermophila SB210]